MAQGEGGAKERTDIGNREPRQNVRGILMRELRIRRAVLGPVQAGFGDKPGGHQGQGEMMLPGPILQRLKIGHAEFRLSVLKTALDKIALAFAAGDGDEWRGVGRIGQSVA